MRLRRSVLSKPGIARKRRGKGFAYYDPDGDLLSDPDTLQRDQGSGHPAGVEEGVDLAVSQRPHSGRRHRRGRTPPVSLPLRLAAGTRRGEVRPRPGAVDAVARVAGARSPKTWRASGLTRERVLALALRLLDRGYFRAGGEQYAEEHESYGLSTLLCEHVMVRRDAVEFDFPGQERGAAHRGNRGRRSGPRGTRADAPRRTHRATAGVPQRIRVGRRARR